MKAYTLDDMCCGHMLVLLQYDWPRFEQKFYEACDRIRRKGAFKYSLFFNYIISILQTY